MYQGLKIEDHCPPYFLLRRLNQFLLLLQILNINLYEFIFQNLIDNLYQTDWIVYCKPPFKDANYVLEYLGRYTHRVAITDSRIINVTETKVTFKYRDYKDKNTIKNMTLDIDEFIRRFLLHILPDRFTKIRHYGILSNRNKVIKLLKCRKLTYNKIQKKISKLNIEELMLKLFKKDISLCPCCTLGKFIKVSKVEPRSFSPPLESKTK